MVVDRTTSNSKDSVNLFHGSNSKPVNVDWVAKQEWNNQKNPGIGIYSSVNDHYQVQCLIHKSNRTVNNMLKMVHVIIETIQNGSSWGHIEELVNWCSNDFLQNAFVNSL